MLVGERLQKALVFRNCIVFQAELRGCSCVSKPDLEDNTWRRRKAQQL